MHDNVKDIIQFRDSADRDRLKEFFVNPSELDTAKPTIVLSTPSETGTSYFRVFFKSKIVILNNFESPPQTNIFRIVLS